MSLEVEKLTEEVDRMASVSAQRQEARRRLLEAILRKLHDHATDWDAIENGVRSARKAVDIKRLRAARPLDSDEPLDVQVDSPPPPETATIIGVDGSQIFPDRHQAFLYSLINIGVFVYYHGQGSPAPYQYTVPLLDYPGQSETSLSFVDNETVVGMRRDKEEIGTLSQAVEEQKDDARALVAVLDQRLLYWPAARAAEREGDQILQSWQNKMISIRQSDSVLVGYIANPGKSSVVMMLNSLDIGEPGFDLGILEGRFDLLGLNDVQLFGLFLEPGQRSKVFVDVSQHNDGFRARDPQNEVCFFYINPGRSGRQIARIDLPISAARKPEIVAMVHSLLYDQCQIIGDYPYVLARADEVAVVGRRDQEHLNMLIEEYMARHGLEGLVTPKLDAKELARAGKSRHGL